MTPLAMKAVPLTNFFFFFIFFNDVEVPCSVLEIQIKVGTKSLKNHSYHEEYVSCDPQIQFLGS